MQLTAGSRRHADHATNTSHITRATQEQTASGSVKPRMCGDGLLSWELLVDFSV